MKLASFSPMESHCSENSVILVLSRFNVSEFHNLDPELGILVATKLNHTCHILQVVHACALDWPR